MKDSDIIDEKLKTILEYVDAESAAWEREGSKERLIAATVIYYAIEAFVEGRIDKQGLMDLVPKSMNNPSS